MAITIVGSASAGSIDGGNSVTTAAVDMSLATLFVLAVASFSGVSAPTVADDESNDWIPLTAKDVIDIRVQLYYAENPTVSVTQTFSATGSNSFASMAVLGLSGAAITSVFDAENGATDTIVTSIQTGNVTPAEDNEIIVTALGIRSTGPFGHSIDGGFTINESVSFESAQHQGIQLASLIQVALASANPTWSWSTADAAVTVIASFKAMEESGAGSLILSRRTRIPYRTGYY